jgi:CRP/FNR family transcriptional regulator
MNLFALLSNTDLFNDFSEKSKKRLAALAAPRELRKGQVLFVEGEKGAAIYLLATGAIHLSAANDAGDRSVVVKTVKQGELFAEAILFEESRYPVTAMAIKRSLVFTIPKDRFICLLGDAGFRDEFIRGLFRKLRYLAERLRSLATMDVADRLFHFLEQQYGERERIVPGISKKDLAAAIGATPETLSRLLLRLKREGTLVWSGREIVLKKGFWQRRRGAE